MCQLNTKKTTIRRLLFSRSPRLEIEALLGAFYLEGVPAAAHVRHFNIGILFIEDVLASEY